MMQYTVQKQVRFFLVLIRIDTQYGIGKDGDNLKIGISNVLVDSFSNISIGENNLKGPRICGNFYEQKCRLQQDR